APQGQAVKRSGRDHRYVGEAGRNAALSVVPANATPGNDGAVALKGQAMTVAAGDRGHAGEPVRYVALSEVVAGSAAEGDDCAVVFQSEAVGEATGERRHAGEAARHAALPVVVAAATPCDRPAGQRGVRRTRRKKQSDTQNGQQAEP